MCSAPAASGFVRGATDIMTFGTAEIGGVSKKLGDTVGSTVASPKAPPMPAAAADPGPAQITKQTPGNADAQAIADTKARKAAAMRAGIMSTIGANLGSIGNTTPNTPAAYASGMKTVLGQ